MEGYSPACWWPALFHAVGLIVTLALHPRGAPSPYSEGRAEGAVHM
ncbi:hypothetical protein [Streptomyces sp. NPDC057889]